MLPKLPFPTWFQTACWKVDRDIRKTKGLGFAPPRRPHHRPAFGASGARGSARLVPSPLAVGILCGKKLEANPTPAAISKLLVEQKQDTATTWTKAWRKAEERRRSQKRETDAATAAAAQSTDAEEAPAGLKRPASKSQRAPAAKSPKVDGSRN